MAYLHAVICTSLGEFEGKANPESADVEDLLVVRDRLQQGRLEFLVLHTIDAENNPAEISFPKAVLDNSVIVFTIKE